MEARLNLFENAVATKVFRHINSAGRAVSDSTLPHADAGAGEDSAPARSTAAASAPTCTPRTPLAAGEDPQRLHLVAAWREAKVFTEAERAALELAEQGTRIADAAGGVTDEAWANAAKHYDEEQLAALVSADRPHQHLQPAQRHRPAARRRLPARHVRLTPAPDDNGPGSLPARAVRPRPEQTAGGPIRLPWQRDAGRRLSRWADCSSRKSFTQRTGQGLACTIGPPRET